MKEKADKFNDYFSHLKQISLLGRLYKRYISSPVIYKCARQFGTKIIEVGSGIGSGILGAYPNEVCGIDVNSSAVELCKSIGLNAQLVTSNGGFPILDEKFDVCVLDNVLEHIQEPRLTLDECYRITKTNGGLVIVVPGIRGFQSDSDHKIFYGENELSNLDSRWELISLFSLPFIFKSKKLSNLLRQYCLVATYKKV